MSLTFQFSDVTLCKFAKFIVIPKTFKHDIHLAWEIMFTRLIPGCAIPVHWRAKWYLQDVFQETDDCYKYQFFALDTYLCKVQVEGQLTKKEFQDCDRILAGKC